MTRTEQNATRVLEFLEARRDNSHDIGLIARRTGLSAAAVRASLNALRRGGLVVQLTSGKDAQQYLHDMWSTRKVAPLWMLRASFVQHHPRSHVLANGRQALPPGVPAEFRARWEAQD